MRAQCVTCARRALYEQAMQLPRVNAVYKTAQSLHRVCLETVTRHGVLDHIPAVSCDISLSTIDVCVNRARFSKGTLSLSPVNTASLVCSHM